MWWSAYQNLLCLDHLKHVLGYNECKKWSFTRILCPANDYACTYDNAVILCLKFVLKEKIMIILIFMDLTIISISYDNTELIKAIDHFDMSQHEKLR